MIGVDKIADQPLQNVSYIGLYTCTSVTCYDTVFVLLPIQVDTGFVSRHFHGCHDIVGSRPT